MWKITAGRGNAWVADFIGKNMVAIGWSEAGDFTKASSRSALIELFAETWPDQTPRQLHVGASQVWRFLQEVRVGDRVVTYDPNSRLYHVGSIAGETSYRPELIDRLPVSRPVKWEGTVSRDVLSASTRNTLGAIMTIFMLSAPAAAEVAERSGMAAQSSAVPLVVSPVAEGLDLSDSPDPFADIADQALERTKDRILRLSWEEMQELVAALLRALGYRTIISAAGADRGRDIIASRDGFGFEAPRIVVEVKHRKEAMGAPEVRAFLGGRHAEDRGLYVSTGGFTREAQYEAERAATVTHLMTLDGLARALVEQYEHLDERGRKLLPLTRLYWPV